MGVFLLVTGLVPIVLGILVFINPLDGIITLSDRMPAVAAIVVGSIYALVGVIDVRTKMLDRAKRIIHAPSWVYVIFYIVVLPPVLVLCYLQAGILYR